MTARTIAVAALQLHAHERAAFESVWPAICEQIRVAAGAGAQLVVLPEGTVPAYVIGKAPIDSSVSERALADVQRIASQERCVIVYGSVRVEEQTQYNSAFVVDSDGSFAGNADKCFLWHFDHQWFAPGEVRAPVRTTLGNLGVMICADGRIPTIARALATQGAELLVMPTAWVTSGRDAHEFENAQADLLAMVRARENGLAFVAANKCGVEAGGVAYCGKSQLLDHQGAIVSIASQTNAQVLHGVLEVRDSNLARAALSAPSQVARALQPARIAISADATIATELLEVLEAPVAISGATTQAQLEGGVASGAIVNDAIVLDPGGLVPYRHAGYQLVVWRTGEGNRDWIRRFARARALELRIFVVVIVDETYAFAVDPDGAIVCGTFGNFRVASFTFDPARTAQTFVAPSTDILEGLARAQNC